MEKLETTSRSGATLAATSTGRAVLVQEWHDLAFLHFAYRLEDVAPLVPASLEIDTFPDEDGVERAWVGLVGFRIRRTRPPWGFPLPVLSSFDELNVRTYVRRSGYEPGVLFLSLDAPSRLVAAIASLWFKVRYRRASPTIERRDGCVRYASDRSRWKPARTSFVARAVHSDFTALPGSAEHFLTERYRFYAESNGELWTGKVRHEPYRLRSLEVLELDQQHLTALGLPCAPMAHACACAKVLSEFFPVERVRGD